MNQPKVVLVGRDKAPSMAFQELGLVLQNMGLDVRQYLGHGDPITTAAQVMLNEVSTANVVLCGMSSAPPLVEEECRAIYAAHDSGIPVLLYADTHGAVRRPWFEDVRRLVSGIFVVSYAEMEEARELFPDVGDNIFLSGNPSVEAAHFPKVTREWVRKWLGAENGEKVILIPGYKYPAINTPTIIATLNALALIENQKFLLVLSLHPGDDAWKADPSFYHRLIGHFLNLSEVTDLRNQVEFRVVCSKHPEAESKIATSDLLPGTDLVVATMSTIEQEAACQRIPVVEYLFPIAMHRMQKNFGTQVWEPCEQGVALKVFANHMMLAGTIEYLLDNGRAFLLPAQERHYPRPDAPGHALGVIVEAVQRFIGQPK